MNRRYNFRSRFIELVKQASNAKAQRRKDEKVLTVVAMGRSGGSLSVASCHTPRFESRCFSFAPLRLCVFAVNSDWAEQPCQLSRFAQLPV